ncbi:MAG TPA: hypothetical protein VGM41_07745 [Chitinophagaceae bacterium]|jgi:hypothetical protein
MITPYRLITVIVVLLFLSCKGPVNTVATSRDTAKVPAKDTNSNNDDPGVPIKYREQARLDLPGQVITLTSRFVVVDGKVDKESRYSASSAYFVHIDKRTGKADTVEAGVGNLGDCMGCTYIIRDMTDSFQLKPLVVQIVTHAEDIYYTNSFVGMQDGHFKQLFSIDDTREEGIELHRQGSKLVGHMAGRDDVVENLEFDYPVIIDTKTFEQLDSLPDRQYIGFTTTALQSFRAHRVVDGHTDSSLVAVKTGAEVKVDTLYRTLGKVRLRVKDSVEVELKVETAKEKLGHNGAG